MADQAVLNHDGQARTARKPAGANGLLSNVGTFGSDLASLATLQSKLAAADARESLQKAAPAIAGLVVTILLAVAGLAAAVAGLALRLAETLQWSNGSAFLAVGLGAIVIGALVAVLCFRSLTNSFTSFRRSSEEFDRNLAWIKTTLTHSGR